MNTKTAVETLKMEFVKGMVNKDFYSFSRQYPTLLKCQIRAMEEYSSPLKKRIEELESALMRVEDLLEEDGYTHLLMILKQSTNGK